MLLVLLFITGALCDTEFLSRDETWTCRYYRSVLAHLYHYSNVMKNNNNTQSLPSNNNHTREYTSPVYIIAVVILIPSIEYAIQNYHIYVIYWGKWWLKRSLHTKMLDIIMHNDITEAAVAA